MENVTETENVDNTTEQSMDSIVPWAYEWFHHIPLLAIPLHGYFSPILSLITLVVNTLFCIVLLQPQMRSPTNLILAALSISNTLNGLVALPVYLYFYTFGNYKDPMPYAFCWIDVFCYDYLPCVFHTASIYYTVALACQRYAHVCVSNRSRQYMCATRGQTALAIVAIGLVSALLHVTNLLDKVCHPIDVTLENRTRYSGFVGNVRNSWFVEHEEFIYPIYYWFRAICIHLLPCTILAIFNGLLFRTIKEAAQRRDLLLASSTRERSRKHNETSITLMLVLVVTVFLIVEIPTAIILLLNILQNINVIELTIHESVSMFANFAVLISYPLSFLIYTYTSCQFRNAFKALLGFKSTKCSESEMRQTIGTTVRNSLLPRINSKSAADSDNSEK